MNGLPTGTVTFLFTDIEGSTKLAQDFPDAMPALLARHHEILHQSIRAHNGYVFQIIGDAFAAAFHTAPDALKAAIEAQRALVHEAWNPAPIKVRMGIHTGAAQAGVLEERAGGYVGYLTLTRVQRVMSAAHGGQILLSNATAELVRGELPRQVSLRAMGEHRLKGLVTLDRLWQPLAPDLPADFPPLHSPNQILNNLPVQLTSFIGREKEIAEVKQVLEAHRLVTLTGSGGTGKTRLSLQVAAELLDHFDHGIWFIELAPLTDPDLIPPTILTAVGMQLQPGRSALETLTDFFREKSSLLVLDNCEHLIEACAKLVETLLNAAPNLRILTSSREALGVKGEQAWRVPSLSAPDIKHLPACEQLSKYETVRLFIDRALLVQPQFALTNENSPAVAQICHRLDGIPLAIELAAARLRMLSVEQIAARLNDDFRLLTGGSRTALPRHQTLRALIDWSYDLLPENERILLRRLAVFSGGCTLEGAERVCSAGHIQIEDILDLLTHLVDKSLVTVDEQPHQLRYRLLETVRQYAREKFSESGEGGSIRNQHLDYFLALARRAEPEVRGADQKTWFNRLEMEHDNFRAALEWSLTGGTDHLEAGLQMASSLWWFWFMRGYLTEGGEWLERTLMASQSSSDPVTRAKALSRLAWLKFDPAAMEEGLVLARGLGPAGRESMAIIFWVMGRTAWFLADYDRATSFLEQGLQLFREIGLRWGICETLTWLGIVLVMQGDHQRATDVLEESLALARQSQDVNGIAFSLWQLGNTAAAKGNYEQATKLLEEGLALYKEINQTQGIIWSISSLGKTALKQKNYQLSITSYKEALALYWETGNQRVTAQGLEQLAYAALHELPGQAAKLLGAAEALRESSHMARFPNEFADYESCLEALHSQLDETTFATCWAEGRTMTGKQAVAYALKELEL